ncbi:methyl-accepting chemotaxis (MCP) signaling domain protein, partial [Vibrio parahaemolyticus V-223/04]
VHRNRQQKFAA